MFNCLSIDKEKVIVLLLRERVTSTHIGQAQNDLTKFIAKMK